MDCAKVGRLIMQFRKEKGMTQQQVADLLRISNKTPEKAAARSFYLPEVILYHEEKAQKMPCLWGCDVPVCTGNPLS